MNGQLIKEAHVATSLGGFLTEKITSLNKELDSSSSSSSFLSDFYPKIENMSYLSAKNMAEHYTHTQKVQDSEEVEIASIIPALQQLITNFKSFMINAETNASLLKERVLRLEVIKQCL